jgi:hypothetical protein
MQRTVQGKARRENQNFCSWSIPESLPTQRGFFRTLIHLEVDNIDTMTVSDLIVQCTVSNIQYKCLVPIYVYPEMKLLFPKQNYKCSVSQFLHSYVCERFIYFHDWSS